MLKNNFKNEMLKNLLNIKNVITYIIAFMISTIGMGQEVSPFSIAIVGACLSGGVPAIGVVIAGLIGNIVRNRCNRSIKLYTNNINVINNTIYKTS